MKKKIICIIIILLIVGILYLFVSGTANKIYRYYIYADVLDYGKELNIYEILGENIDIGEYTELKKYVFKKAKVKSIGSTAHFNIKIGNNNIVYIGNRNLIEINDILYVYYEQ